VGTRQRLLCRVSAIWHSAKNILNLKKNLCRVPDRGHSAKSGNKLPAVLISPFSPLTLSSFSSLPAAAPSPAAASSPAAAPSAPPHAGTPRPPHSGARPPARRGGHSPRWPLAAPGPPAAAPSAPPHAGTPRPPTQAPARLLAAAATRHAGPPPHGRARHARRTRLAAPSRAPSLAFLLGMLVLLL
jgi:hypothetical protein